MKWDKRQGDYDNYLLKMIDIYIESIKGSDLLNENSDDLLKMTIRTHKGINIESIEKFKKE